MADLPKTEGLFRRESLDRISSPEEFFDCLRVSNPGVWMVLGAILALLGAGGFWAFRAEIPLILRTHVLSLGEGVYRCYVPLGEGGELRTGMTGMVHGREAVVIRIGTRPLSRREASEVLPDEYAAYALGLSGWNVPVDLRLREPLPEEPPGIYPEARITLGVVRPLSLLLGEKGE
jgi:hypothetical protein